MTTKDDIAVAEIIDRLGLEAHPEGGFYTETYRSDESVAAEALPGRYGGKRDISTAIYYLLTAGSHSAMHRVKSDEFFHFYLGDPVEMLHLFPDGSGRRVLLGSDLRAGEIPQVLVRRGVWQGARVVAGGNYALAGTTVAPGFDFDDFEFGARQPLIEAYSEHAALIAALTAEPAPP